MPCFRLSCRKKIIAKCKLCNKLFSYCPSSKRKFCSFLCSSKYKQLHPPSTAFKKGHKISEKLKKKLSIINHQRTGNKSHHWKSGRIMRRGYVFIYIPEHPFANHKYVLEHRLVAEKILGRYLTKLETVHHINEIRNDNRPKNLFLFLSKIHHNKYHRGIKAKRTKFIDKSNLL